MTNKKTSYRSFGLATLLAVTAAVPMMACGGDSKPAENPQQQGYNQQGQYPQQQGQYPQQQGQYPQQQGQYPQQQGQYPQQQGQYPQQQPQQQPQGQYPQQQPPQQQPPQQQPPAAGSAAPPSPFPGLDPNLLAQIQAAGAAVMAPGGAVGGDMTDLGLKAAAARYAPGMQPEGAMAKDTLAENGHKEMTVTMQGGKCYTIIGFSPLGGIKNVDLHLMAPPFYNVQAGADSSADNTAVIGGGNQPTCPITPFPIQYKLDIHAKQGGGPVGVQVYSKTK
jgi:hypothetical protein